MRLYDLKTLHMKKCVGIDQNPYFSWKIANDKNDTVQCAYQLQVLCDEECLWDTGKVESEKQSLWSMKELHCLLGQNINGK